MHILSYESVATKAILTTMPNANQINSFDDLEECSTKRDKFRAE